MVAPQALLIPSGITQRDHAPKVVGSRPMPHVVPLPHSVVGGKQNYLADAALVMGRSFRVGWGPNWTLVHSGKAVGKADKVPGKDRRFVLVYW